MHSVLEQRKQWQKQYISIGKTDLFYNGMGLCGNFTDNFYERVQEMEKREKSHFKDDCDDLFRISWKIILNHIDVS